MSAPRVSRVLETALYVDNLDRAAAFYEETLGATVLACGPRLCAMDAGESTVLLLFLRGATTEGAESPAGWIPPHDGAGPAHLAFAVEASELDTWRSHLDRLGIAIESEINWSRGGTSLYFRDPDGHSVEIATPGVWETY